MGSPSTSVTELLDPLERRARVDRDLAAMPGLGAMLLDLGQHADLEAELDRCRPPLMVSPVPNRATRRRYGIYFDPLEVRRFLEFSAELRHVKGRYGNRSLVLDLWEVLYLVGPVFGWRQENGDRYFREFWLEVPRKNGKSTLACAVALYMLMADSNLRRGRKFEPGAEVYAAATTKDQARYVFTPAEIMARRSPTIAAKLAIRTGEALICEATVSTFSAISGDPAKAEEKMGGNVSAAIVDEIHVHKDGRLIETIETGTSGRDQPLVGHLTTAGADTEGTIYAEKHDLAVAICSGEVTDVRTWAVIYTIPDDLRDRWDDPEVWGIANPGLEVSVSLEYLEDAAAKGRRSNRKRLAFCRLHLNVRTSTVSRWIDLDAYDASGAYLPVSWPDLRERVGYAGLDLSNSMDLSALGIVVPLWVPDPDDPEYELEVLQVVLRAWTPADRVARRAPKERELFSRWIREGHLIACRGEVIDYDEIEAEAVKVAEHLELDRVSFDRWGSKQMVGHLAEGGLNVVEVGQGFAGISGAMKETERLIAERRLRTCGNPLLRDSFANLAVETDAAGNIKPNRAKSTGRVDPAVAVVMAVDGYTRSRGPVESAYEDHDLVIA